MGTDRNRASALRIIVMGYIVRGPLGGLSWHHLQYVMGLAALGHTVHFLEDSDDYPDCYDPIREVKDTDPGYGLAYAADVFDRVGLPQCWAYHDAHTKRWHGPQADAMPRLCKDADLLLDVSGVNPMRPWVSDIPARALIDTDPVFTQIRHLTDPQAMAMARQHNSFFTFGENYGKPGCSMPVDGLPWVGTRQPVVLDAWPVAQPRADGCFTTVMQWESYRAREYGGVRYGMKSASFPAFMALPSRAGPVFELALGGATAPRKELAAAGWRLRNSVEVTRDPWTYQAYIRESRGEFSIAKEGYVASRSGWFSERSAGYLASGKPVLAQDTGFSRWLPTGEGLLSFSDADEVCAAIDRISADYRRHCSAARDIAERSFASDRLLTRLVERAMAPQRPADAHFESHATGDRVTPAS